MTEQFKIGDKVRVKNLIEHGSYGGIFTVREMSEMSGQTVTIRNIIDTFVSLEEGSDFTWSVEMFERLNIKNWRNELQ